MHNIVYSVAIYNADTITKTVGSTIKSFVSLISYISSYTDHEHVFKELSKLDLEYKISIIDELVKDCCNMDNLIVNKAIIGLNDILHNINKELQAIDELIRNHNKKYFSSWRDFNCDSYISSIKHHAVILTNRYKILIDLLALYK